MARIGWVVALLIAPLAIAGCGLPLGQDLASLLGSGGGGGYGGPVTAAATLAAPPTSFLLTHRHRHPLPTSWLQDTEAAALTWPGMLLRQGRRPTTAAPRDRVITAPWPASGSVAAPGSRGVRMVPASSPMQWVVAPGAREISTADGFSSAPGFKGAPTPMASSAVPWVLVPAVLGEISTADSFSSAPAAAPGTRGAPMLIASNTRLWGQVPAAREIPTVDGFSSAPAALPGSRREPIPPVSSPGPMD